MVVYSNTIIGWEVTMNVPGRHRAHVGVLAAIVVVALLAGVGSGGALALAFLACVLAMGVMVWLMMSAMNEREDQSSAGPPQRRVGEPASQIPPPVPPARNDGLEVTS